MSSGFVTEAEAAEARQKRQEEWEKVRKPEDPLERPEEPYDGRSLYDRLKENKMKKDMEYEESHKLKNLIRGLDDDEVQFLELVDQNKINSERKQMLEEKKELEEFRNRVATLQEESASKKLQSEIKTKAKSNLATSSNGARNTQKALLGIGIKRKNGDSSGSNNVKQNKADANSSTEYNTEENTDTCAKVLDNIATNQFDRGALKCIAVLPGIGPYTASSDSELSTDSDEDPDSCASRYDLCGRKHQKKKCQQDDCQ